jgi:hypothetical protein
MIPYGHNIAPREKSLRGATKANLKETTEFLPGMNRAIDHANSIAGLTVTWSGCGCSLFR